MSNNTESATTFNRAAAVTRSMLGWGVLAGPIYLVTGLALALTRDDFDLGRHQLSLLMLGDHGWMQRTNLLVSGVLCLIAAVGIARAMRYRPPAGPAAPLVAVFGMGLLGSGVFAPDPMGGFPAGAAEEVSASGLLHMAFGLVQFVCLAIACFALGRWARRHGDVGWARISAACGVLILVGFAGGAALATSGAGVALLWLAVLVCYSWLALICIRLWKIVPHPDC